VGHKERMLRRAYVAKLTRTMLWVILSKRCEVTLLLVLFFLPLLPVEIMFCLHQNLDYEHSEQARAPHTNGPRDVPRCGALSLLQKTLHYKRG
jgi:hypothetical protein